MIAGYPGIDVRADKGYVLLPPSNHKSGNFYAWLTAPDAEIADLPQWFIELVKPAPHPEMELEHEAEMPQSFVPIDWDKPQSGEFWVNHYAAKAHPGERDDCMALLALQLRDSAGLNFVQAEPYARMYARTVTQSGDPYDEERAVKTLRSILLSPLHGKRQPAKRRNAPSAKSAAKSVSMATARAQSPSVTYAPSVTRSTSSGTVLLSVPAAPYDDYTPPPEPETKARSHDGGGDDSLLKGEADDNGNAEAMYRLYGRELLFTPAYGWLRWTGTHWSEIPEPIVAQKVITTLKRRRHAAVDAEMEAIVKATKADRSRVVGCLIMFKSYVIEPNVAAFDAESDLLNCKNGVLDLRTGTLTPHSPTQRFTYCLPVDYDPDADDTEWRTFILEALGSDPEVADYMQLWAGTRSPAIPGKRSCSTCMVHPEQVRVPHRNVAELLPRPLSAEADFANLTGKRDPDSQNFDLAGLKQARMVDRL